ncbi:MAG TPA: helix-turn-helix domain-containing protein [Acidobacteriota bacterium]|nr:helix-turn-helix domain-containing protein [Acidobacteriota bacterium]
MDKGKIIVPDPAEIEPEDIGAVMAQMAAIQLSLATRLVAGGTERVQDEGDSLLTVDEAAARLKCSSDWLYRRAKRLPFTVRVGRNLRFSARGIDQAIRAGIRCA